MPDPPFTPSPLHPLTEAFQLTPPGELIALTGGGGKTSLLFALGRELAAAGQRVIATTTTRLAAEEVLRAPTYCLANELDILDQKLDAHRFVIVVDSLGPHKAKGVPLHLPARLLARPGVDAVLVEADGAQRLPIKAPAEHEPAVPPETTLLVPLVGIDALSAPLQEIAHRPQRLAALLQRSLHEQLSPEHVARLLAAPHGGMRNAPPQARVIPFINKVENDRQMAQALEIARGTVTHARIQRVLIGALQTNHPLRHIIDQPTP